MGEHRRDIGLSDLGLVPRYVEPHASLDLSELPCKLVLFGILPEPSVVGLNQCMASQNEARRTEGMTWRWVLHMKRPCHAGKRPAGQWNTLREAASVTSAVRVCDQSSVHFGGMFSVVDVPMNQRVD